MTKHLLLIIVLLSGVVHAEDAPPKPQTNNDAQDVSKKPVWHLICDAHKYKASLVGPWIIFVDQNKVKIKDKEITYAIDNGTAVSGMRDGKGQTIAILHQKYGKAVASEAGIRDLLIFTIGTERINEELAKVEVRILKNTVDATGNGYVTANLEFPKGFGEARADENPLASIFVSCRADAPLLMVFCMNYALIDEQRRSLPLVYPTEGAETRDLFLPAAP